MEKVVLETWTNGVYVLRLVTDGETIKLEYKNIFLIEQPWTVDSYAELCRDEAFNMLVPSFNKSLF